MVVGVTDALTALKSASDLVKALVELRDVSLVNSKALELQRQILAAHEGALAAQDAKALLHKRVAELEAEVMRFETWETEKQRYELHKLPPGILIYRTKLGMEGAEPAHEICANCYQKRVKSLLHIVSSGNGRTHWKCHECGFDELSGTPEPWPHRGPRLV